MGYTTEVVRRIYHDYEGVFLEVSLDADSLNLVRIHTANRINEDWFGKIDLTMDPVFARSLAHAILACADEAEEQERKDNNALS